MKKQKRKNKIILGKLKEEYPISNKPLIKGEIKNIDCISYLPIKVKSKLIIGKKYVQIVFPKSFKPLSSKVKIFPIFEK
jgi:hypothetical protein